MSDKRRKTSARQALCLVAIFAVVMFSSLKLTAQSNPSARAFVSQFYNWYVPQALQDRAEPAWHVALKKKSEDFAPPLARLLRADWAAQDKCEDLVGLDFDPFLNSQDPAQHYEVGEITREGSIYKAAIYSMQAGQRGSKPDVSASLKRSDGRWMFINFYYPDGGDLVTILKAPKLPCSSPRRVHK
jgi:hypothetical protein